MGTTDEKGMQILPVPQVEEICARILEKLGVPEGDAETVTRSLVRADLQGIFSHGISRLPTYARKLRAGLTSAKPDMAVIHETPATILLDGKDGLGIVVGTQAMKLCIAKARRSGAAVAGVRNGTHFGTAGFFALMAAEVDMIGLVSSNGAPRMAPWGGKSSVLGTNPLAIASPTGGKYPLLLDMATSAAALGKVIMMSKRGEEIPEGWATDKDGYPTRDPQVAMQGLMLPVGGPKGYGMALMLDVLCGVLMGACFGKDVGSLVRDWNRTEGLGFFFFVINIASFLPIDQFKDRIDELCEQLKHSELAPGSTAIYLPGEIEFEAEERNRQRGVSVEPKVWDEIQALASELEAK